MFRFGYVAIKMTRDIQVVQIVQYNGWFDISKILRSKISAGARALAISHSTDVSNTHVVLKSSRDRVKNGWRVQD